MTVQRPLLVAFAFLSCLPVGVGQAEEVELGRSLAWFPVVGLVFGMVLMGAAQVLRGVLPLPVLAVLLVALLAALSSGLHLDGLADVFDGLGGGRGDRERTLDIMRDSRIGAHGATALVLVLAVKIAAVHAVLAKGATCAFIAGPVVARWSVVPLVAFLPYARAKGLGRAMVDYGSTRQVIGATGVVVVTVVAIARGGSAVWLPLAVAVLGAGFLATVAWRRLGGLTGDVYGACIEIAEAAFWLGASGVR